MKGTIHSEATDGNWHFSPFGDWPEVHPSMRGQGMLITPLRHGGGRCFYVGEDGDGRTLEGEGWIVEEREAEAFAEGILAREAGPVAYVSRKETP